MIISNQTSLKIIQSLFEKGTIGKTIRDNSEIFVLFRNYGDSRTNTTMTAKVGLLNRYKRCVEDAYSVKHGYCCINNSNEVKSDALRVGWNLFGEFKQFGKYPLFYT